MEQDISKLIINEYFKKLKNNIACDVAIVGGGPSGLVCAYFLAKNGVKTSLFESKASLGGGIWGGGMMFNIVVVQKKLKKMYKEFGIKYEQVKDKYLITGAPELASALIFSACKAGVEVFNFINVEDIAVKDGKANGLVLNWSPVNTVGLHVDPLTINAKYIVDATGHESSVVKSLLKREDTEINKINIHGENFMNASLGEEEVINNSREIFPGLFTAGMASNAVCGGHRMGPIFGGMMLSGEKVAKEIIKRIKN